MEVSIPWAYNEIQKKIMPYYEYECKTCGLVFDIFQHMDDPTFKNYSHWNKDYEDCFCDGLLERKISTPMLRFVGPGFYINDYKGKK